MVLILVVLKALHLVDSKVISKAASWVVKRADTMVASLVVVLVVVRVEMRVDLMDVRKVGY